jgi:AcrR family transcriptional regulator
MMSGVETSTLKPRQRKPTAVRRTEIVDSAMRLVAELGGRGFTTKLLASRVGLTEGAIFRHFPSMEAIADAMVDRMEALLFESLPRPGDAGDPLARLEFFFRRRVLVLAENPHVSRLLLSDHVGLLAGESQGERVVAMKRRSQAFVRECLREAAARGELERGVTPAAGEVLVLGAILAIGHSTAARARSRAAGAALADEVWALVSRALRGSGGDAAGARRRRSAKTVG